MTDDQPVIGVAATTLAGLRWVAFFSALLAVLFSACGHRFGLVEFRPGGSSFDSVVRPIFLALFVVGIVAAIRWEIIGGLIAIFAAAGIVAFATNNLIAPHAALTVGAFAVPVALWIPIDLINFAPKRAAMGLASAAILAVVGFLVGSEVYDRVWGPTNPESTIDRPASEMTEWIWAGSTTSSSSEVRAAQPIAA